MKPLPETPNIDLVAERISNLRVISNRFLQSTIAYLPVLLVVLLVADWLIGGGVFANDLFRLSGVLSVAIELLILGSLFKNLPETLGSMWTRGLVSYPKDTQQTQDEYIKFMNAFEAALNSRWSWSLGIAGAIAGISATYPVRFFLQTGNSPFDFTGLLAYYFLGNAAFIAAPLGYLLGILIWRTGVIVVFISKLGRQFKIMMQPNHPDRCGGLRPLGNLCLTVALLLIVPAIFLSVWGFATTFFEVGGEIYTLLWSGLFRQWLAGLSVLALFAFLQPLYSVHLQMQKRRREIQAELDELTQRIDELSKELRTQAYALDPKQGEEKLETLAFMKKVYQENSHIPTWPVDWQTLLKFSSAQVVPILGLIGTSEPVIVLVKSIVSSTAK